MKLKLKRHETFLIRDGWLEKGILKLKENPNAFKGAEAQANLGIGTNMVKSLRYWLEATHLTEIKGNVLTLSDFGNILLKFDPFLEDVFSWWLIHFYLVADPDVKRANSPVFSKFFNIEISRFDKISLFNALKESFEKEGDDIGAESSLESDIAVLLRSYSFNDIGNPEENTYCPLSVLGLIEKENNGIYKKTQPKYNGLDSLLIYWSLLHCVSCNQKGASYNLEDIFDLDNNPSRIFNLSKSSLLLYLDNLQKKNLISIIKTAGLNTITFNKVLTLNELCTMHFNGYFYNV